MSHNTAHRVTVSRSGLTREQKHGPIRPADDPRPRGPAFALCWTVIAIAAAWGAVHAVRYFAGG